jgi:hypothetical protein
MMLQRFLIRSFKKHKGLALLAILYYFYSLTKKKMKTAGMGSATKKPAQRKR